MQRGLPSVQPQNCVYRPHNRYKWTFLRQLLDVNDRIGSASANNRSWSRQRTRQRQEPAARKGRVIPLLALRAPVVDSA